MSGLDTRYVPSSIFQEGILDKDTGFPLAAGVVTFYKDNDRTPAGLKPVYQLTGSPPNYTYTPLPNPLTLSSIGTIQDGSGNDVIPYFLTEDASGELELYYFTVVSAGAVPQFTREGVPNIGEEDEAEEEFKNFAANGQFLLHHNIVADENGGIEAGEITSDVVTIAEGGWTFERTASSTAKDFVLFERLGSFVETPSKSPRYSLRVKNESPGVADTFKDVRLKFNDVNKFSSDTNKFTYAFQAKSNTGSGSIIEVKLIKNYGTGGSAEETSILQTITLTTDYLYYDIPFVFGSNDGKTIGSDDDDFVQLVISFPVSNVFDDSFNNFILAEGDKQVSIFPDTTDEQMVREALAGQAPVPNYEGEDLYLPVLNGPKGFVYQKSVVGDPVWKGSNALGVGELWFDGTKYRTAAYSSDGIPYKRLHDVWSEDSTIGLSRYGTGPNEMRCVKAPVADQSFTDEVNDLTGTDDWQSFTAGNNDILKAIQIKIGGVAPASLTISIYSGAGIGGTLLSQTSGYVSAVGINTIYIDKPFTQTSSSQYTIRIQSSGTLTWKGNNAGGYTGGSYNGGAADAYFITLTEPTTDPAIYALRSNTSGSVIAAADGATATGFTFTAIHPDPYVVNITFLAAASVAAGSYWTYNTTDSRKVIPWYRKDGSGTKPVEAADVYLPINILGTDTDVQVAKKTAIEINSYSYLVPNLGGYFLRVTDNGFGRDPDAISRFQRGDDVFGDAVGTYQADEMKNHVHKINGTWVQGVEAAVQNWGYLGDTPFTSSTSSVGGLETRPTNIYFNLAVKY
jgi:hypothetical protein